MPREEHDDLGAFCARLSLAIEIEEVLISTLSTSLSVNRHGMPLSEIAEVEHTIREHRISILKQRARMDAIGMPI
ncbi:hypothetical protein GCM10007884_42030 [Methylobacterium brachythecii]|uniref:Uncharacterized protein n=1 Tax=Methylobacterium brachythecii TaxID=1176177 RepID=A0ABQ6D917_9HYPH|nr:hypothetical protein GCM10007884_42030 [Methylobacterium brachythecii]